MAMLVYQRVMVNWWFGARWFGKPSGIFGAWGLHPSRTSWSYRQGHHSFKGPRCIDKGSWFWWSLFGGGEPTNGWVMVSIIFLFSPLFWGRFQFWLIFFKWVETTNQNGKWVVWVPVVWDSNPFHKGILSFLRGWKGESVGMIITKRQMMSKGQGVYNHLRNARCLGSITILTT